jgi:hypothetical protein
VLGDAYGCGIVAYFSRDELKRLDEDAEHEFAQIISATSEANPNQQNLMMANDDSILFRSSLPSQTNTQLMHSQHQQQQQQQQQQQHTPASLFVYDEGKLSSQQLPTSQSAAQQLFSEFRRYDRRPSNRSQISFADRSIVEAIPQPPSIVVMDAFRRRSRAMLFGSKIPSSVTSMPQISNMANQNIMLRQRNQDSNV